MATENIELASAIAQLRAQLEKAIEEGVGKQLRFQVQDIDLELKCTVKDDVNAGGGVKFWVINAEAKAGYSEESVQTVRLKLKPVGEDGGEILVSDIDSSK
ncbi:MAG: trypco2 family protein [bacterium]